eukprot:scaffold12698_cov57-Attheya_sp.AAC.3
MLQSISLLRCREAVLWVAYISRHGSVVGGDGWYGLDWIGFVAKHHPLMQAGSCPIRFAIVSHSQVF